ncbi:MAG: hypothetical protein ACXIUZ_01740 [Lysobacteraceae bacterium]
MTSFAIIGMVFGILGFTFALNAQGEIKALSRRVEALEKAPR